MKDTFYGNDERATHTYDKLFYGNNLPSINTSLHKYTPTWEVDEIGIVEDVMRSGLRLFTTYLKLEVSETAEE